MGPNFPPTVWQVSGGPSDRPYVDVFLKYGVALIGPGMPGEYSEQRYGQDSDGRVICRFANDIKVGDVLILRSGRNQVLAMGVVASEYQYREQFDDVEGWDLQHCRRVHWLELPEPYSFEAAVFGANPARFSGVNSDQVIEYAMSFFSSGLDNWRQVSLPALPNIEPDLVDVPAELHDVIGMVQDLSMLYWTESALGGDPNENEMVAHFVVPFLRALRWPVENIAVEWRNIDVALFEELPRTPANCRLVIEAKRLGTGLAGARVQARDYVNMLGVERDLLVTDGFRYELYACDQEFTRVAYANLERPKQSSARLFDWLRRN